MLDEGGITSGLRFWVYIISNPAGRYEKTSIDVMRIKSYTKRCRFV